MKHLIALALAAILAPAYALGTPPPPEPAPVKQKVLKPISKSSSVQSQQAISASHSAASSDSSSASDSSASSASDSSVGDVAPIQSIGGDRVTSRSWSLFFPPPAYTPPMAPIQGCAARVSQSSVYMGWGAYSKADSGANTDPCTLIAIRNAKVESCQYASAKQIEDLLTEQLLPSYKANSVKFDDLTPKECAAIKAPKPVPVPDTPVNLITDAPKTLILTAAEPPKEAPKEAPKVEGKKEVKPCPAGWKRNSKGVCYKPAPAEPTCPDGQSTEKVCRPKK